MTAWRRVQRILLALAIAASAAVPLVGLWNARVPTAIPWAAGVMRLSEDERLRIHLGARWDGFIALRDRTPASRPVILVLPLSHETSDIWASFTALLYPKRVLVFLPSAEFVTAALREYNIDYDNTLEAVVALAGPEFDVTVFEGSAPLPGRLSIEVRETGRGFVLGRGTLAPDAPSSR